LTYKVRIQVSIPFVISKQGSHGKSKTLMQVLLLYLFTSWYQIELNGVAS